jgi:uncharacterized membrane protein
MTTAQKIIIGILSVILLASAIGVHTKLWQADTSERDIYYAWLEGKRILENQNPYSRILEGDMLNNDKYATYFPAFYLLSSATQAMGNNDYESWIAIWRYLFLLFHLGIGIILFWSYIRINHILLGFVVLILWLFGNRALQITHIAHIDFIPVFFLILSLVIFDRRPFWALFLASISLAIKQIAIFLVPLYLIWLWRKEKDNPKKVAVGVMILVSVPLLTSLPFLIREPAGYIRSIMFSMTRYAYENYAVANMISEGGGGIMTRLPMIATMLLIIWLVWQKKLKPYSSAMITMFAFAALTPVLFPQYELWVVALLLLSVQDGLSKSSPRAKQAPTEPSSSPDSIQE